MSILDVDTTGKKPVLLNFLTTLSVDAFLVCIAFEGILFFGGGTTKGSLELFTSIKGVPIVAYLTIIVILHILLMLPALIYSFFSRAALGNGMLIFNILLAIINFVFISFFTLYAIIPWWHNYLFVVLKIHL